MTMKTRILLPVLALFGCGQPKTQKAEAEKPKPISVETVAVVEREVPNTLLLAGTLKANQESELAANASGRVMRTMVERGSYVAAGAPVAQLDVRIASLSATEAEANVETARTQRSAAQVECARYAQLLQRGVVTQQEYDRQATNCKAATSSTAAAETHVELAKQTLSDGTVRAPFAGLVSERYVSVIGGHVDALYEQAGDVRQFLTNKQIKPVIIFAKKRLPAFPDVPSSTELGFDITLPQFRSFVVKSGTPPERVKALSEAMAQVAATAEYKAFLEEQYAASDSFVPAERAVAFFAAQLADMKSAMKKP